MRELIVGKPLSARGRDSGARAAEAAETAAALDAEIARVTAFVERVYPATEARTQAVCELSKTAQLPINPDGITCRRAVLLFATCREREVADQIHASESERAYARNLRDCVLPLITERFFAHSCQNPRSFVEAAAVLSEMWHGEQLGNWPRPRAEAENGAGGGAGRAHHDRPVAQHTETGDGEG
jgi:hypothetical protein